MFRISNYLLKNSKSSFFIILLPLRIMKNDIFNKMSPSEALEMFDESLEPFLTYLLRQAVSLHLSVSSRIVSVFAHNVKARNHSSNALSTYKLMNVPNPKELMTNEKLGQLFNMSYSCYRSLCENIQRKDE